MDKKQTQPHWSTFHLDAQHVYFIVLTVALAFVLLWLLWPQSVVSQKSLGECLTEKGVTMYGVDTCINCQEQKDLFGKDFSNVNYINCDFDKKMCQNRGITFYPVWSRENSVLVGTQSLQTLAEFAGCEL